MLTSLRHLLKDLKGHYWDFDQEISLPFVISLCVWDHMYASEHETQIMYITTRTMDLDVLHGYVYIFSLPKYI